MPKRDTSWRQGSVLTQADAIEANLFDESRLDQKRAIIITHDCDLPNDKETDIEVIVGTVIAIPDKQFARARNVRRLHLAFDSSEGTRLFLDLQITDKLTIPKASISGDKNPDSEWILPDDEKRVLKQWLAARYGRPAFPNAFETHLRKKTGKYSVEQLLDKSLEKVSSHLVGVFFDLGKDRAVELDDGIPYDLRIVMVYDSSEGGQEARLAGEQVAAEIEAIFESAYGAPDSASGIALESCEALADTFFPLSDLRKVDQWRAEYISLRQDPPEPFIAAGEIP
jgi:hypothetical protein